MNASFAVSKRNVYGNSNVPVLRKPNKPSTHGYGGITKTDHIKLYGTGALVSIAANNVHGWGGALQFEDKYWLHSSADKADIALVTIKCKY